MSESVVGSAGAAVVIAESDAGRRSALRDMVQRFDPAAAIHMTSTGEGLIDLILNAKPSLAFVGLQLDGLSGPEAVALARKRGGVVPGLVLISSRVLPQWQEIAQNLGAYEVLKTPLDPAHIEPLLRADARRRTPTPILLASSSEPARTTIGRVLGRSGFNLAVDETDCGRHALKLLKLATYDIAFLDVRLGGLDGMELACQIQPANIPTRVVLLTTTDAEAVAQAGRYFGVDAVLKMPFYARDIDLALHHALGLRRPYLLNAVTAPPAPSALLRIADLAPARRTA